MILLWGAVYYFRSHVGGLVAVGVGLEEIGEEEQFQNDEYDEQFDEDNRPQRLTQAHGAEPLIIQVERTTQKTVLVHRR